MKELLLIKRAMRWVLAIFFILAGINHFMNPSIYLGMMPPWIPYPDLLHRIAGGAEILGGVGLLIKPVRVLASWGLILLLVAVFPANVHAAIMGSIPGLDVSPTILWVRLPFQAVFVFLVWWVGWKSQAERARELAMASKTQW